MEYISSTCHLTASRSLLDSEGWSQMAGFQGLVFVSYISMWCSRLSVLLVETGDDLYLQR